ncbi:YgaP family membrane protein [Gracilibacillus dipsosauri]|uniref:YgaP family membrane protein n=1 Tax=Gracilibacillus dipsosauri TaxID=178340 RepID=UPI0024090931
MSLLPPTTERVQLNTSPLVNKKITHKTELNISKYLNEDNQEILKRLKSIEQEWDTERILETSAASFILLGTYLGIKRNQKWHLFSGFISFFLLQHSLQGWCPPLPLIRKLGVRTANEINEERNALNSILRNNKN